MRRSSFPDGVNSASKRRAFAAAFAVDARRFFCGFDMVGEGSGERVKLHGEALEVLIQKQSREQLHIYGAPFRG